MIRIGFSGSRWGMTDKQYDTVKRRLAGLKMYDTERVVEIHHGDCIGADATAHELAEYFGFRTVIHPPTNPRMQAFKLPDARRKPLPYLKRNREIVNETEVLIATPSDRRESRYGGTWSTVRYARSLGRPCLVVFPSGEIDGPLALRVR